MKRIIYTLFLIAFLGLQIQAKDKLEPEETLKRLYDIDVELCIQKGKELSRVRDNRTLTNYYLAISYHALYVESSRFSDLKRATVYLDKFNGKSKVDFEIQPVLIAGIKSSLAVIVQELNEKAKYKKALKYSEKYTGLFNETLSLHNDILAKLANPSVDEKQTASEKGKLIRDAENLIGTRYQYGGNTKSGMDCSGFTSNVFGLSGIMLPRTSSMQSTVGTRISRKNCKPGDLIFFGTNDSKVNHVGIIYANDNGVLSMIHCPKTGVGIEKQGEVGFDNYWEKRILFIKRMN
ncbi:MAG: C40 family peptidase [Flavobacteriales bacterium]|nr:C40 family peptidase [Flavobacteriales bacterium]